MTDHRRIARVATLALATAAIAAPTASARFSETQGAPPLPNTSYSTPSPCSEVCSGATPISGVSPSSDVLSTGGYDLARVPTGTVTYLAATSDSGFDWGDAGIGAGVAVAIVTLLAGTLLVLRRRPQPPISRLT